jgi:hypothetical protein
MFQDVSDIRFSLLQSSGMLRRLVWQRDTDVLQESAAPICYTEEKRISITQFRRNQLPQCSTLKMEAADISETLTHMY